MEIDKKLLGQKILILVISSLIAFCQGPENTEPIEKFTAILNVISGKNQQGNNNQKLTNPIVIIVADSVNNPLPNIQITFQVIDGGGSVDDDMLLTDEEGVSETYWTLGSGSDHIMKISITDQHYFAEPVYIFAQTEVDIELKWISDISFPRLFNSNVDHDNRILESNHFLVFSDRSSDDAKIKFVKTAEETFYEVMQAFNINNSQELGIIVSNINTKPKLFSNVSTTFPYGGFAYRTGYVYPAFDSQSFPWSSNNARENYRADVKHETVHVVQFLVGLDNLPNMWPDVWFSEGLAVLISYNCPPIATVQELNEWRQIPGNENPITVKDFNNYPTQGRKWYNMFGTAVKYLLHEKGHGKTTTEVLEMYRYMDSSRNGFADAFERYMGMSVQYYEENYWELITDFLMKDIDLWN